MILTAHSWNVNTTAFVSRLERSPVISDVWDMISSSLIRACTAPLAVQRIIYHNYRIFLIENIWTIGPKYHNIFIALQTVQCSVVESSQSSQDAPSTISKHTMNPTVMWRDEYLMHQNEKIFASVSEWEMLALFSSKFLNPALLLFGTRGEKIENPSLLIHFMGNGRIWDFGDNWIWRQNIFPFNLFQNHNSLLYYF